MEKGEAVSKAANPSPGGQEIACPETKLILACSRYFITPEGWEQIKSLLQGDLDWVFVIKNAQLNGVTPLLCHNLLNTYPEFIPQEFLNWLKEFLRDHSRNNLYHTMGMLKIIRLLETNDIPTLPIKGPTLAALLYGNVALRQFCDLDILVQKKDIQKSIKILADHGYHLLSMPSWFERLPTPASRKKDVILVNNTKNLRIELHWRLSGSHFDLPFNIKNLCVGADRVSVAGHAVKTLPFQELLLYLTMHGSRHGWVRLAWVCDIAELIRVQPSINWGEVMAQARALGCERTLNLGLFLANSLLQTTLPVEILERIETDRVIKPIAAQVTASLFNKDHVRQDISYWYKFHLKMKERLREGVRVRLHYYYRYLNLAITPNEKDFSFLRIPRSLNFFYYLLRPLRFAREYGVRLFKRGKRTRELEQ